MENVLKTTLWISTKNWPLSVLNFLVSLLIAGWRPSGARRMLRRWSGSRGGEPVRRREKRGALPGQSPPNTTTWHTTKSEYDKLLDHTSLNTVQALKLCHKDIKIDPSLSCEPWYDCFRYLRKFSTWLKSNHSTENSLYMQYIYELFSLCSADYKGKDWVLSSDAAGE